MTSHADQARDHIAATRAAIDHVEHLHASTPYDRPAIAAAYDSIRQGLKLSEVYALLDIGDQLAELRAQIGRSIDATTVELLSSELDQPAPTRHIVVAPSAQRGRTWCAYHGIQPHASTTRIVSTPDSVRGLTIGYADEVLFVDGCTPEMAEALAVCYLGSDVELPQQVTNALGGQ